LAGIADFLGIAWNEAMLDHGSRGRATLVRTPSYGAVAQPLNDRATGRWRRYRRYLSEFDEVLAPFVAEFGYPPA
jgi:hypothetical protein